MGTVLIVVALIVLTLCLISWVSALWQGRTWAWMIELMFGHTASLVTIICDRIAELFTKKSEE